MQLKPIQEQVVVVVGASSGIGRATALRFAARGAKVVVAARCLSCSYIGSSTGYAHQSLGSAVPYAIRSARQLTTRTLDNRWPTTRGRPVAAFVVGGGANRRASSRSGASKAICAFWHTVPRSMTW